MCSKDDSPANKSRAVFLSLFVNRRTWQMKSVFNMRRKTVILNRKFYFLEE